MRRKSDKQHSMNFVGKRSVIFAAIAIAAVALLAFGAVQADAATIDVPSDYPTIQQAIDNATADDTINIASGYTHDGTRIIVDKDLTIEGNNAVIDAGIDIESGADVVINNLTIQDLSTADTSSWSGLSTAGSEWIVVGVRSGTLTATNLDITQTNTLSAQYVNLVGISVQNGEEMTLNDSTFDLTNVNYSLTYGVYAQQGATGVSLNDNTFNLWSERRTMFIGTEFYATGEQVPIQMTNNVFNAAGSDFGYWLQVFSGGTFTREMVNNYIDGNVTAGRITHVYLGGWYDYISGGPCDAIIYDGQSIQTAIDEASPGHTICVGNGTYNQSLLIDKPLTLQGAGANQTIINGSSLTGGTKIKIEAYGDLTIDGFTIDASESAAWTTVIGFDAMALPDDNPGQWTFTNNTFEMGTIYFDHTDADIKICNNVFNTPWEAVGTEECRGAMEIGHNEMNFDDVYNWSSPGLIKITNFPKYWENSSGPFLIPNNVTATQWIHNNTMNCNGGIGVMFNSKTEAENWETWGGPQFVPSAAVYSDVVIENNVLSGVGDLNYEPIYPNAGIMLKRYGNGTGFENVMISGNTISPQLGHTEQVEAIELHGDCKNATITGNTISDCDIGVHLNDTVYAEIFGNTFSGNTYDYYHCANIDGADGYWASIQDAIDNVTSTMVDIYPGTYLENVYMDNKTDITIQSVEGPGSTIINAAQTGEAPPCSPTTHVHPGFYIRGCDNITIQGLTIKDVILNATSGDIYADGASNPYLMNSILLFGSSNCTIMDNVIENFYYGIHLSGGQYDLQGVACNDNRIVNNTIDGKDVAWYGINMWDDANIDGQQDNVIAENTISGCYYNIYAGYDAVNTTIVNNTVTGSPDLVDYFYTWGTYYDPPESLDNGYGIRITGDGVTSTGTVGGHLISGNTVSDCKMGVLLNTFNVTVEKNNIYNNGNGSGIDDYLHPVTGTEIHNNNIYGNRHYGVLNIAATVVNATYNWWGHSTGPYHNATDTPYGQGDNVSDNVDFRPWLDDTWPDDDYNNSQESGVEDSYYEDVPAGTETTTGGKDETGTTVTVNTSTPASVTTLKYEENPEGDAVGGYALDGTFVDVSMNDTSGVDWPINITIYYTAADLTASGLDEGDLQGVFFWNGTAGEWQLCNVTGVNTDYFDGTYIGYVWAHVWHLSPHAAGGSDNQAPTTTKTVGEPKWGPTGGANYVTSSTEFNFTAVDNPSGGSGVNATYYRVWYNGAWTPAPSTGVGLNDNFMVYTGNFTLSGECIHYLEFYSDDNAGNMEAVTNQTHRVDDTPPQSGLQVGDPKWPQSQGATYITTSTELTLFAQDIYGDCNVGSWRIHYRLWNQTDGWTTWQVGGIGDVVHVTFDEECKHYIEYYAVDNLDNTETTIHNRSFYVDDTPPSSAIERGEPSCGNYALDFNGSNYVEVPHAASLDMGSSDWTVEAWIQTSSDSRGGIVRKNAIGNWQPAYDLEMQSSGRIRWLIDDGTNSASLTSSVTINDGQWHHIVATRNGGTIELYIDGSLDSSAAAGTVGAVTTGNELYIGCMADGSPPPYLGFEGAIDDVRIYDDALSAADVQNNYNQNVVTSNLVSWWDFNEGSGSTATDVEDGNDGTIYGATYTTNTPYACVTTATPIYVNATDPGAPCAADNSSIWYRIWNGTWTTWQRTYYQDLILTFDEECKHYLEYYTEDSLGNGDGVIHNITFYVDDSAPTIDKTVGTPNIPGGGMPDFYVTTGTPITIDATNAGCCPSMTVEYRIWNATYDSGWMEITVSDTIYMPDECMHNLSIRAYDCVGNIVYDNETFYVDDSPPTSTKEYGTPYYEGEPVDWDVPYFTGTLDHYITSDTTIYLNATDNPGMCASGVDHIEYYINRWDGSSWQGVASWDTYTGPFTLSSIGDNNSCLHRIRVRSFDELGHIESSHLQHVMVDNTPPVTWKEHDGPMYMENETMTVSASLSSETEWYTSEPAGFWIPQVFGSDIVLPDPLTSVLWAEQEWSGTTTGALVGTITMYHNSFIPTNGTYATQGFGYGSFTWSDGSGGWFNGTYVTDHTGFPSTTHGRIYATGDGTYDGQYFEGEFTGSASGSSLSLSVTFHYTTYVTTTSEITINATDNLSKCSVGSYQIYYRYWKIGDPIPDFTTGPMNSSVMFSFDEECEHMLEWYVVDDLGTETMHYYQHYRVDDTPPMVTKEYGNPTGVCDGNRCITTTTPIYLNATDAGDCAVGSYQIFWRIWDMTGGWGAWQSGPLNSNVSFTVPDECKHYIEYYAVDDLGNYGLAPGTYYVDDDFDASTAGWGVTHFDSIQDAIDAASDGDTIYVYAGTYTEAITIDKELSLYGAQANVEPVEGGRSGGESTIADPSPTTTGFTVVIRADNVVFNGFEVIDFYTAIDVRGPVNATRSNVVLAYNYVHSTYAWSGITVGHDPDAGTDSTGSGYFEDIVITHNRINASATNPSAPGPGYVNAELGFTSGFTDFITYTDVEVSYNDIQNPDGSYGIFAGGDPNDFEFHNPVIKGNHIHDCGTGINVYNLIDAQVHCNLFENCSYHGAQINVRGGTITNNTFQYIGPSPYWPYSGYYYPSYGLALWGTSYGPVGSHNVSVEYNTFYYNNFSPEEENAARALTGCDVSTIEFHYNNFYDGGAEPGALALKNYETDTMDAENNWWDTTVESEIQDRLNGSIDYDPWESSAVSIGPCPTPPTPPAMDLPSPYYVHNQTFYVDDVGPSIDKTVGDPNITVTADEEYYVTTLTPIYIDATDPGCCPGMTVEISVNGGAWQEITVPYVFNFNDECTHTLDIRAYDCLGRTVYDNETFHVDSTPPLVNKTVVGGGYDDGTGNYYVNHDATVYLNVTELPDCSEGNWTLHYRIWWDGGYLVNTTTDTNFSYGFSEDCIHYFEYWVEDELGNRWPTTGWHNETFYVDSVPPTSSLEIGDPKYPHDTSTATHITTDTWLLMYGSDTGCPAVGMWEMHYRIWRDNTTLVQSGDGTLMQPFNITIIEECNHTIEYWATDYAGNEETPHNFRQLYVDDSAPDEDLNVGSPSFQSGSWFYVTLDTPIWLNATDMPASDCAVGNFTIHYRTQFNGTWTPWATSGSNVSIDFTENCTHRLQYWIEDELGNRFPSSGYRTWGFHVGGGLPDATLQFGSPYYMDYITKYTPIYINATGDMAHTNYQIYYNVNNGSWHTGAWNSNVTFTFDDIGVMDNCTHTIYYNITNNMGEWEEYNYTVNVDNIKPTVNKDVGMPQYGENVTSDTPFWLNVSDAGSCSSGIAELNYRIYYNGSWHTYTTYGNTTFTFGDFVWNGECEHTIEAYAVDNLGHESTLIYQTHYVDDTPPTTEKEYGSPFYVGSPVYWNVPYFTGTLDHYITSETPIYLNATDNTVGCASGVDHIEYYINRWNGASWETVTAWTPYTGAFNLSSLGDDNNCLHRFSIRSFDNLGNMEDSWRQHVMVDNTPPDVTKEVGEPKMMVGLDEYCIETGTPIWINATDNGTLDCVVGSVHLHYRIWYNGSWTYYNESVPSGTISEEIYLPEECTHYLEFYVEDNLGNRWPASGWHNETFHVDDYPPVLYKTVGDPNVTVTPGDEYYVTTGTPITIDAETGCCDMTVMYNNGSGWVDITGSLPYVHYFDSECDHWLNVTITDAMGRTVYDNETFHVDDTPPTTTLEYGTPYYTSGGDEWITTGTTVYLNATDHPACASGVAWINYSTDGGATWDTVYANETFTIPTECSHTIQWYAVDELGNTETTHSTDVNVDSTPPSTTIEYGGMHYTDGTDTWISTGTTIYLNATDGPACASGVATIYYTYNGTWQTASGDVSFTIPDNCTHTLEWYAVDNLGHTETTHTQTVNVDDAAPSTTLEYGTPYYTDGTEEWITPDTTIYLNATDHPACASGVAEIWYNYGAGWNTVVGSQATFDIPDECTHSIEWYAVDNLGHEETHHFTDVNVDDTAPTATLELGTPYYTDGTTEWITSDTTIYINTTEYPACASGIAEIVYSYDGGTSWYSVAATQTTFSIPVECNHTLIWYAVDNLGNEGTHHTRDVKVDNTPPAIENTVGEPKVVVFPGDKYYITSSTVIDFTASDQGCSGGVGWKNITYRTWYNGSWSNWTTVTPLRYTITLSGEGVHYLEIIASDELGNTGYDNVTFIVDDTPPDINKTVGIPSDPGCSYNDWVVETGTDIILSATDASPALAIQYSLDGGAWTSVANPYVFNFPTTGIHTLDIRATDGLGHVSYDNETFWVASDMSDSTPPTSWHTPTWIENSNPTPNTKITIKAEDDDNPWQIHYRINGGAEKTGDVNQYVNLHFTPGQITLEYWAVDLACNEETPHHVIEFRVAMGDITDLIFFDGPHELVDGKHEITTETKIGFDFDKAQGMGITEIWYRVNKGTQITGEYSRYYTPFTLDEGTYTIYYYGIHQTGQKTPTASTTVYISGNEAPQTSITLNPSSPDGNDGWYTGAVTAMLSATDPDGDATTTYYRIDDGDWNEYTGPFTIREHDQHTISYYSVDTEDNEETPHSKTVKIDGDAPEITLHKPGGNLYIFNREIMPLPRGRTIIIGQISIEASVTDPATSGVDSATLYLDGTAKGMFQEEISYVLDETLFGEHTITIEAYDVAGNRAVKEITATILNIRIFGNAGP